MLTGPRRKLRGLGALPCRCERGTGLRVFTGPVGHLFRIIFGRHWVQASWPPVLSVSATAISPAEMTTHSNNMACCQPRRRYS